jgi:hypothetical protein
MVKGKAENIFSRPPFSGIRLSKVERRPSTCYWIFLAYSLSKKKSTDVRKIIYWPKFLGLIESRRFSVVFIVVVDFNFSSK